ncbi:hypothetical protein AGR7C_Cc160043 [Agrobacterium deltaense Zutra 3/1]|uniref:Uncharacterized protein n=2 Tax=Agrobacterium deltaense TaxID=1183412 RepID=A0A1S7PJK0_9HYPH|nr:hypothetical protein AGR7C_Cc160043 [Agrobacterium deltaense Zutra 3/1]CUX31828.1 hypothetical protein AGR7B_Cc60002 [Agrobacterium deltaense RV3]CVI55468.1 hypothetical protein AGR7A_Cc200304 [Agrobacterium deltaense NCPPB 1641]
MSGASKAILTAAMAEIPVSPFPVSCHICVVFTHPGRCYRLKLRRDAGENLLLWLIYVKLMRNKAFSVKLRFKNC